MAKGFFSDSEITSTGGETVSDVLIEWGNEVIAKLKESLKAKTSSNTTKNLEQSLVVLPVEIMGDKWTLQFQAEDYWKFINSGVQGKGGEKKSGGTWANKGGSSIFRFKEKKPPLTQGTGLSLWAYTKNLNPFAVRESVFRQGIKATHFFDDVISKRLVDDLIDRLEKAGAREVEITLSKDFKLT